MSRKIVFCDADGTLIHLIDGMTDTTLNALKALHESGVHMVLCTGRSYPLVPKVLKAPLFDGCICAGGTLIRCGTHTREDQISPEEIREILAMLRDTDTTPILCGETYIYYDPEKLDEIVDPWLPWTLPLIGDGIRTLDDWNGDVPIHKICVKTLNRTLGKKVTEIFRTSGRYTIDIGENPAKPDTYEVEIIPGTVSKGEAVRRYLDLYRKETSVNSDTKIETWAMGDGNNDIEMFRAVDHSIAMGNASERVRSYAEYTTADFTEDGAAIAIHQYLI